MLILDNNNTILILGAGSDQVYAIRVAKEMGFRTLVVDIDPLAKGFNYADEFALISNRDLISLKNLCDLSGKKGHRIKGVFLMGSDIPNIQSQLAEYLNLVGPTKKTAELTTNKFLMKEVLRENNIPIPWYKKVNSFAEFLDAIKKTNFEKYIIKPVDRSGARGVFLFDRNSIELENLYKTSKSESLCGDLLVEEYIPGNQISTESIIIDGKVYTPGFVDRNYEMLERFSPHIIENGGNHPSEVDNEMRNSIYKLLERSTKALGILNGNAKGDIVVNKKGEPMIIEIASRLSGGDFSESLIPLGCGVNIVKSSINLCLGNQVNPNELNDKFTKFVANRYFFTDPGFLEAISISTKIDNLKWLKKLELFYKVGEEIKEITSHANRVGVFVVVANSIEELNKRIEFIYKNIDFIITK